VGGLGCKNQKFITAGERFTQTVTAKTKTVINFDKNLWKIKCMTARICRS